MIQERRVNLLAKVPLLRTILKSRVTQPAMMMVTLFVFAIAILTGLFGTQVGRRNFGIVFVWIVWWALLMIVLVPFAGRAWCAICPIPAPGEWLQRRGIINRIPGGLRTLRWRWPRQLKNMWLQNFGFMAVAIFSAMILTRPTLSAVVLFTFVVIGIVLSVLFDNRVFCRYVCPVGGFIGLYSLVAPVEVRVQDPSICATHTTKDCITGNAFGYGCPWMVYPGKLARNNYCGMCMECRKTCPKNNIVSNLRPAGADLLIDNEHRLDEAYKAFIMLGCALLYSAVLLGPWGWIKQWANMDTLPHWLLYAAGFITLNLVVLPVLFGLTIWMTKRLARQPEPLKKLFVDYAYTLIPFGLAAWIAFSLSFVFINGSYAVSVLSDPFGWGWNLFGTANFKWTPFLSGLLPFLQVGVLMVGLVFATNIAFKIATQHSNTHRQALLATLPISGFLVLITVVFLGLYIA